MHMGMDICMPAPYACLWPAPCHAGAGASQVRNTYTETICMPWPSAI